MKHYRGIALLTALVLTLALCAASALAEEHQSVRVPADTTEQTTPQSPASPDTGEQAAAADQAAGEGVPSAEESAPASAAGPDQGAADLAATAEITPDEVGFVSFENVERRMREKNLTVLTLQETITGLESIDYESWAESMRKQLNNIASSQWMMSASPLPDSYASSMLGQTYDTLREQFDDIRDGKMQADNESAMRQLRQLQDQVILGGEMMYVTLAGLESQEAGLQRQLSALNRTVEEMELRYRLGQISALQLTQAKAGRSSLVSGMETLRMNIRTLKTQLELMIGAELTGEIRLGAVPAVTAQALASMDLEKDLEAFREISYDMQVAEDTLEAARDKFSDSGASVEPLHRENPLHTLARHEWQGAKYTYNEALQSCELKFRTLYAQVKDYQQIWEAAKVSLESERAAYAADELRHQQGIISQNALLAAQDALREAEEAVASAANNLFSSYNSYCWAVQSGILN